MPTFNKTLTINSTSDNRDVRIEDSSATRVKITIAPEAGEKFGPQGMDEAAKLSAIGAFELATAFLRAIPPGCSYCLPEVSSGDVWAGGASTTVTFEHDGIEVAIVAIEKATQNAIRDGASDKDVR